MAETRLPRWKSWHRFWVWAFSALFVALLLLSALEAMTLLMPLLLLCLLGIGIGAAELFAPRRFLEWREADGQSSRRTRQVLEAFDTALGTSRDNTGEFGSPAIRRVRTLGGCLAAGFILLAGGLVAAWNAGVIP